MTQPYTNRHSRQSASRLDRPGFLTVSHVPEHPLVAARGIKVTMDTCALGGGKERADRVRLREHLPYHSPDLTPAVGVDPPLKPRIRRAAPDEFLANFPVNPVTGQDRADAFGI